MEDGAGGVFAETPKLLLLGGESSLFQGGLVGQGDPGGKERGSHGLTWSRPETDPGAATDVVTFNHHMPRKPCCCEAEAQEQNLSSTRAEPKDSLGVTIVALLKGLVIHLQK